MKMECVASFGNYRPSAGDCICVKHYRNSTTIHGRERLRYPDRRMMLRIVLFFAFLTALPPATTHAAEPGEHISVYVLTMGPGEASYERFGHNALLVDDPDEPPVVAYNYGVFDFEQKNFIWNFIQGRMVYWLEPYSAAGLIEAYRSEDRDMWVQELNLTPRQKIELRNYLKENAEPQNREYRYDYYMDNCSTRVRDAIDAVVHNAIKDQTSTIDSGHTFRWHTRRLSAADVPLYVALDYSLGGYIDRPISRYDEMFLPQYLMEHLRQVKIETEDGQVIPLVKREKRLNTARVEKTFTHAPDWTKWYLLVGIALAAWIMLPGIFRQIRWLRWSALIPIVSWSLLAGVAGGILTWAWFTNHHAAWWNENWFLLNIVSIVLVVGAPLHMIGRPRRWVRWIAMIIALLAVIDLIANLAGLFPQINAQEIALAVPVNVAIAFTMWRRDAATTITME